MYYIFYELDVDIVTNPQQYKTNLIDTKAMQFLPSLHGTFAVVIIDRYAYCSSGAAFAPGAVAKSVGI